MRLTEMRVQVEKRGGGVAADGALLGLAGPEVDRVDVARQGTCGERESSISLRESHAEPGRQPGNLEAMFWLSTALKSHVWYMGPSVLHLQSPREGPINQHP